MNKMEKIQHLLDQIATLNKEHNESLDATGERFNIFRACGVDHRETRHTKIIAEFLNPDGSHGFKEKFLQFFLEILDGERKIENFDCASAKVKPECSAGENGRMDIFIEDDKNHAIIIENKIYARDGSGQIKGYSKFANKDSKRASKILYLSLWGDKASDESVKGAKYICVSYKDDIVRWLEKCVAICDSSPLVQTTLIQYINHVKSLTNQDKDVMHATKIIQKMAERDNLEAAFSIGENFMGMKYYLVEEVLFLQISKALKIPKENINIRDWQYCIIEIIYQGWTSFNIRFQFDEKGLVGAFMGIWPEEGVPPKVKIFEKIKQRYPENSNEHWAYWDWFPKYRNWKVEAWKAIQTGEMAGIFKEQIDKILKITKNLDM